MNMLYLECQMGAAGDMLTAALLDLFDNPGEIVQTMNHWGIPGVEYRLESKDSHGIRGACMHVLVNGEEEVSYDVDHEHCHHDHEHCHHDHEHCHHDHEHCHHDHEHSHHDHHHATLADIRAIVDRIPVDAAVRADILEVYKLIAEAESAAHGVTVEEVHFHEVGNMDAVADIAAVCYLMHELHPDKIVCSPVHIGSGHVHCAHGTLPVPAPATAWLLRGIPCYAGDIRGELCTPTGAALIRYFAKDYSPMPMMCISKIGYGMGHKAFERINCVRAFYGSQADCQQNSLGERDTIVELACNIDDMTPEALAFAQEQLWNAGAVEVFTTPVSMKKSRCAFVLTVHTHPEHRETVIRAIFKHTTTIGVRESVCQRYIMQRQMETLDTRYGRVEIKKSSGYGVERQKYEYEDMARIAREQEMSLHEVKQFLDASKPGGV